MGTTNDLEMNVKVGVLGPSAGEAQVEEPMRSMPKSWRRNVTDAACIMLNIASTVVLVFLNKWYV
jgi:hypothetical protein